MEALHGVQAGKKMRVWNLVRQDEISSRGQHRFLHKFTQSLATEGFRTEIQCFEILNFPLLNKYRQSG